MSQYQSLNSRSNVFAINDLSGSQLYEHPYIFLRSSDYTPSQEHIVIHLLGGPTNADSQHNASSSDGSSHSTWQRVLYSKALVESYGDYAQSGVVPSLPSLSNQFVASTALPDLYVRDADVGSQDISDEETVDQVFSVGDTVALEIDVGNRGDGDAGSSRAAVYMSVNGNLVELASNGTRALDAGERDTSEGLSFEVPEGLSAGTHAVVIAVDADAAIEESDESNNFHSFFIQVRDDTSQTLQIDPETPLVSESSGVVSFTITRDSDALEEVFYYGTYFDAGAQNEGDYQGIFPSAIVFAQGVSSRTISINILDDDVEEGLESFRVYVGRDESDPRANALASATFTIEDDDGPAVYSLSIDSAEKSEGDGFFEFTISRTGNLDADTVFFSTFQDQGSQNENDYFGYANLEVDFNQGQSTASVFVNLRDDGIAESAESFAAIVHGQLNAARGSELDSTVFTILDDDNPSTFSILDRNLSVLESDGFVTFTIRRDNISSRESIWVSTVQSEGFGNRGDYDGLNTVEYVFASGQRDLNVAIDITSDTVAEADESFAVWVQANEDDPYGTYADRGVFTIIDDDGEQGEVLYDLTANVTSVVEDDTNVTFTVTRSGGALTAATLFYTTFIGTASARYGRDYDGAIDGRVTFAEGDMAATFTIGINEDAIVENDEYFDVVLSESIDSPRVDAVDEVRITILNDDTGPEPLPLIQEVSETVPTLNGSSIAQGIYAIQPTAGSQTFSFASDRDLTISTWASGAPGARNSFLGRERDGRVTFELDTANSTSDYYIHVEGDQSNPALELVLFFLDVLDEGFGLEGGFNSKAALETFENVIRSNLDAPLISPYFTVENGTLIAKPAAISNFISGLAKAGSLVGYALDIAGSVQRITESSNPQAQAAAEFIDTVIIKGGIALLTAGSLSTGLGAPLTLGLAGAGVLYSYILSPQLREAVFERWDETQISTSNVDNSTDIDVLDFYFDEAYYLETYPEVLDAINSGFVSSAAAYFVKYGIAAGHKPSADGEPLDYDALSDLIQEFSATSFGNPIVFEVAPEAFVGDTLVEEEYSLAEHINAQRSGQNALALNAELSTLANRIARDWMSNNPESAIVLQDGGNPTLWAETMSSGSNFREALANLGWDQITLGENIQIAAVISQSVAPSDVYDQIVASTIGQDFIENPDVRSIGIAEFAGLWVVVVDTNQTANNALQNASIITAYQYGTNTADILFAGTGKGDADLRDGADTYFGGKYDDRVLGGDGNDQMFGREGDDVFNGEAGNDRVLGGAGNDRIRGGTGDDFLVGGSGSDDLNGGGGFDAVSYADDISGVSVNLDTIERRGIAAQTAIDGWGYADTLANFQTIIGTDFSDIIIGRQGGETFVGGDGDDQIRGQGGNDTLIGGRGDDYLDGQSGDDTVDYSTSTGAIDADLSVRTVDDGMGGVDQLGNFERLTGSVFDDLVTGSSDKDRINGNDGDDFIQGMGGNDDLRGDAGNDEIHGGAGVNRLYGGDGEDLLIGGAERDVIDGGIGNDTINGGDGGDRIFARDGDDVIFGGGGFDIINGQEGNDTINGGDDRDILRGQAGDDTIFGDAGDDTLSGDIGADTLDGGAGTDLLKGGDGDDMLTGGTGDDRLIGGDGVDTAVYSGNIADYDISLSPSGFVRITDLIGTDGFDKLTEVEFLQFADGVIDVAGL